MPAGEITFTADISSEGVLGVVGSEPEHPAEKIRGVLETHLDGIVCFKGQGQVAAPGFKQAQMVSAVLCWICRLCSYFSIYWRAFQRYKDV